MIFKLLKMTLCLGQKHRVVLYTATRFSQRNLIWNVDKMEAAGSWLRSQSITDLHPIQQQQQQCTAQ